METERNTVNLSAERAKYVIAVVLYGTIGLFLRHVRLPSEIVVLCRGMLGSVFVLIYQRTCGGRLNREAVRKNRFIVILSGIFLGLNWIFLFAAYMQTTVAIASLCNYMAPMIVILIAPAVLGEPLDKRKLPCVAAAFAGIILVSGVWNGAVGNMSGIVMGLAAAACFVGVVICNRKLQDIPAIDRSVIQLAVSALTTLPYVIIRNHGTVLHWDLKSAGIILMLGVLHTGVAYCLYFSGLSKLPVQTVAILGYLEPVVSVLCSAVFLKEMLGISGWIGAVLIIGAAIVSETMTERINTETGNEEQNGRRHI